MRSFLRSLPRELYWYGVCFIGIIFVLHIIGVLDFSSTTKSLPILIPLYASSTFVHFFIAILFLLIYAVGKIAVPSANTPPRRNRSILRSTLFFLLLITTSGILLGTITGFIGNIGSEQVLQASNRLMRWDLHIFGEYLPFWLQFLSESRWLSLLLMTTYGSLGIVLSITAMLIAVTDTLLLRKFLLSFTSAVVLAFPLWRAFPAISPDELYRKNILALAAYDIPHGDALFSAPLDERLKKYNDTLIWSDPQKNYFGITSFPSMHVAWGILVVFFLSSIKKTLAYIAVPWALLNTVSAVYTLQHYAVDALAGIAIGILAIIVTHYLLSPKRAYVGTDYFYVFHLLQQEQWCRRIQNLMDRRR